METKMKNSYRFQIAQKRVRNIKGFYVHLLVYLFVNIAIFVMSTRDEGLLAGIRDLANYSTALFWGLGLLAHWCSVFAPSIFFGKKWEEKKIQEILARNRQKTWE